MQAKENNTVLYIADVSPLADDSIFNAAYHAVSEYRQKKTDRCKMPKDKYLSLGAELLLRYGLREAGMPASFEAEKGKHGKPYLKDKGLFFNISHSEDYAICAISGREVGCDIEKITPMKHDIAKRFFTQSEYDDILSVPDPQGQTELFYRYWTLKESFIKNTGYGMSLPLNAFSIVLRDNISVIQSVDDRKYSFYEYSGIADYKCALCTSGESDTVLFKTVDLTETL